MAHYDRLEIRDKKVRRTSLEQALPMQIEHAKKRSPVYARLLADIDPEEIDDLQALAQLPVVRRSELAQLQRDKPPFGELAVVKLGDLSHIFQAPGPIYCPEARRSDYWRTARALFAAGFREGHLIHNAFPYHLSPAGFMMESGAQELGCAVIPAGTGQTELQVQAIQDLKPHGYMGTPSFLKTLLDKAAERGKNISSLEKALTSGEYLSPELRAAINSHDIDIYQCYTTADLGLIAYESAAREGLIVDEGVLVEIVRPGTSELVQEGEVGELLVTTFNPEYPLIRYSTGDLFAILKGASPCGRTNARLSNWMGRADQSAKVSGTFIHPSQIAQVLKRHPEVKRARLVIQSENHQDRATLYCEIDEGANQDLTAALTQTFLAMTQSRAEVTAVPVGELANDGKVIDDQRRYEDLR